MYFVRFWGSGYNTTRRDVRDKVYAEYHCAVCGHNKDYDVSMTWSSSFQTRARVCPSCGCMDEGDREKMLRSELKRLTSDKSRIEVEIDQIERELVKYQGNYPGVRKES